MKNKKLNVNFKIEFKDDVDAKYKFIDFLVDSLMEIKKEAGEKHV